MPDPWVSSGCYIRSQLIGLYVLVNGPLTIAKATYGKFRLKLASIGVFSIVERGEKKYLYPIRVVFQRLGELGRMR
jgi:hypothetical protein